MKNNNSVGAWHFLVHFLAVLCKQTTRKFQLRRCCYRNLSWCFTGQFATTIFSAIHRYNIVLILFWMVAALFQHCNNCCESSRLTSSLWCGKRGKKKKNKQTKNYNVAAKPVEKQCSHRKFYHPRSNLFCSKSGCGFWCVNTDFCLDKIALELRHLGSYVRFGSVKRATFTNMYRTTLFTLL